MSRDLAVLPSQPTALASAHNSALSSTPSAALASARINAQIPALTVINCPQHSKCPPAALSFRLCRLPGPKREPPTRSRSAQLPPRPCRLPFPEREPPTRSRSTPIPLAHPPSAQRQPRAANAVALGTASTPAPAVCPSPSANRQCGRARRCFNPPRLPSASSASRQRGRALRNFPPLPPPSPGYCANALAPGFATALALALCAAGPECIQALPAVALSKRPAPPPKDVPECARVPPPQTGTIAHALRPAATRHLPTPQLAMPSANVAKFSRWLKISSAALPRALSQAPAAAPDAARRTQGDLGRHLELVCPAPSPPARPTNRRISDVVLLARLTRSSTRARTTSSN
ncbi:hypothetical protein PUNSTDRAFT_134410 [Punctularia strigosozonata HHB-11173 SS5]|uniref:uncharacterized protein n=1 Tax=Punctularia strigosozonata (strain HHB-11173) TaxID=741275 RepID=UPI0004416A61|nr:uncharacterized protein PUNSTDRAFT_134410 [Punctularia strigosozonata HHB-11173 SS5]EIN09246.1 hypothetical protein PUNSTDRAFT_134410 [Punctularia strigosozonata HHB-11173 SS5]